MASQKIGELIPWWAVGFYPSSVVSAIGSFNLQVDFVLNKESPNMMGDNPIVNYTEIIVSGKKERISNGSTIV